MIVVLAIGWIVHRHAALRAAMSEMVAEVQTLQATESRLSAKVRAFEAGFLERSSSTARDHFLGGMEWISEDASTDLVWKAPVDGLYLVVDWRCPWSVSAAEAAVAANGEAVVLIDSNPSNGPAWRGRFASTPDRVRVVTPAAGWWQSGAPMGITPVWFSVLDGEFQAVGIGADGLPSGASVLDSESQSDAAFSVSNH